jgi:hypothetical protein
MQEGWCNSVNISEGAMALSTLVPFVAGESARAQRTLHAPSTLRRRIEDLPVENGPFGGSPLIHFFGRAQVRTTGLASKKAGQDA